METVIFLRLRTHQLTYRPPLKEHLARPIVVNGEPELNDVEADVLVERVQDDLGIPDVEPSSVDEE